MKMRTLKCNLAIFSLFLALFFFACDDDPDPETRGFISMELEGLPDLGPDFVYEAWLVRPGSFNSIGTFTVNSMGEPSQDMYEVHVAELAEAGSFMISIERAPGATGVVPSPTRLLAGNFQAIEANLRIEHPLALGTSFNSSMGGYILATPTDGMNNNETSGIWFLNPTAGPGPSLVLPILPEGWVYEGWTIIDGTPVSTGRFLEVDEPDSGNPHSGMIGAPSFPGEDFLNNAPAGLTFPTDLSGDMVVITVEPEPDNSPAPFVIKPLGGQIPDPAADHVFYPMNTGLLVDVPTGHVER